MPDILAMYLEPVFAKETFEKNSSVLRLTNATTKKETNWGRAVTHHSLVSIFSKVKTSFKIV